MSRLMYSVQHYLWLAIPGALKEAEVRTSVVYYAFTSSDRGAIDNMGIAIFMSYGTPMSLVVLEGMRRGPKIIGFIL